MSNWMSSMKALLISAGIVLVAMEIKFTVPMAVDGVPALWSAIMAWMKPPYLYLIINGIILTIAASSRFGRSESEATPTVPGEQLISVKAPMHSSFEPVSAQQDVGDCSSVDELTAAVDGIVESEIEGAVVEFKPPMAGNSKYVIETEKEIAVETEAKDVLVDSTSRHNSSTKNIISPQRQLESLLPVREKPLASSRFAHRKPIKTVPEASNTRALRVARPKRQDTLESTWKMITEGRHVPLTRHQKKADTWEYHVTPAANEAAKPQPSKEHSRYESTARIRKEPSPGQDELNRRVEAFIKKFNEEMRMQRQESLKQFMEMINRGA